MTRNTLTTSELAEHAKVVAEHLPGTWRVTGGDYDRLVYVTGNSTDDHQVRRFYLATIWDEDGRVEVACDLPKTEGYFRDPPRIGVNIRRPAKLVANDITKRFLPPFIKRWDEVVQFNADQDFAMERRIIVYTKLTQALEGLVYQPPNEGSLHRPENARWYRGGAPMGYGEFEVRHNGEAVDITLHGIPVEVAVKLAKVIDRMQKGE